MKRETNEVEILDTAFHHRGGELGWSVFGAGRMDPSEVLALLEEGEAESGVVRAAVLSVMLDLCLAGWGRENSVELVGERGESLAAAFGHRGGVGLGMWGVFGRIGGPAAVPVALRILDVWFWDHPTRRDLGKRILALGRFFNHPELEGWSVRGLAQGCGESRTWMSKRVRRECNRPIEYVGGKGQASWQQGPDQRKRSAEARRNFHKKTTNQNKETK